MNKALWDEKKPGMGPEEAEHREEMGQNDGWAGPREGHALG